MNKDTVVMVVDICELKGYPVDDMCFVLGDLGVVEKVEPGNDIDLLVNFNGIKSWCYEKELFVIGEL